MNRRDFIVKTGLAAGGVVAGSAVGGCATTGKMTTSPQVSGNFVAIVADPTDPIAAMTPARWAVQNLKNTLAARGFEVAVVDKLDEAPAGARCIIAAGRNSPLARDAGALAQGLVDVRRSGAPRGPVCVYKVPRLRQAGDPVGLRFQARPVLALDFAACVNQRELNVFRRS